MKAIRAVPVSRYGVFFAIAVVGCTLDLATKAWMFGWLGMPPSPTKWLWEGVFGFQSNLNPGALFGMGQGLWLLFSGVSVVALVGILYWLFWGGIARDWLLTISLGCISAGVLGNLYDRVGLPEHAVRDFILFQIPNPNAPALDSGDAPAQKEPLFRWPNFNIADSLLVCGAAMLLWHAFRSHKETAESQPSP